MNRLAQLLIFLQAKLQINPFQGNTDQLRHLKHHLQNSVTTIDNSIALRTGLMDLDPPAVSKPPSTSTTLTPATKKSDHYRCLFCEPLKKYYSSRGTFKRHVTEKHWPMVEYHCKAPGCLFQSYRKDKARPHNPEALGHVISQTSPACMTVQPDIPLPHPPACSICSKAVGTWREWLDCVFCHCQLPEGDPAINIRGGDGDREDDDSDDDMDNGGFGGGNGNFLSFQNQHPTAMGSQSNGSDIAFSGSQFGANDGYHYPGASHNLYNDPMNVPDQTEILHYLPEMMGTIPSPIMPSNSIEQNKKDQSKLSGRYWPVYCWYRGAFLCHLEHPLAIATIYTHLPFATACRWPSDYNPRLTTMFLFMISLYDYRDLTHYAGSNPLQACFVASWFSWLMCSGFFYFGLSVLFLLWFFVWICFLLLFPTP